MNKKEKQEIREDLVKMVDGIEKVIRDLDAVSD